jgi:SAM-dependent methyltransferase/uncharacterized protein YbaR (Trm112 family)
MDQWYISNLVCPRDHLALDYIDDALACPGGHAYPVVEGTPVMLLDSFQQTISAAHASLKRAKDKGGVDSRMPHLHLESLAIGEEEKQGIIKLAQEGRSAVDPVVSYLLVATNGNMYRHLIGALDTYPIPDLRFPNGNGQTFLELGCSWGRWSIAAARKGFSVIGIDPSLGAIMAAKRVSRSLGLPIRYFVADARCLPFASGTLDNVFSYSVLQHLNRSDVAHVLNETGRVLKPGGTTLIQMPTRFGLRCLYHQARRRFRQARDFEVRYWTIAALKNLFANKIGATTIFVDCFFGLGLQQADYELMPLRLKIVLVASELLRKLSRFVPPLKYVADSVYVKAVK